MHIRTSVARGGGRAKGNRRAEGQLRVTEGNGRAKGKGGPITDHYNNDQHQIYDNDDAADRRATCTLKYDKGFLIMIFGHHDIRP